ncbi:MAG: signal peptidase I [Rubripirellula sp.]
MSTTQQSTAQSTPSAPRSTLIAVLLTLLMTGLGHIYCGELIIGLSWAALGSCSGVISLWALTHSANFAVASIPMWVVSFAAVFHVVLVAKRCPPNYQLRSFNRTYVYALLVAISSFGVIGHGLLIRSNIVTAYVTPSRDMEPTLRPGDRFLADKTAFRHESVGIGDLIVFKDPATLMRTFVKRVAATAGSRVEVEEGQLLIDGEVYQPDNGANHDLPPFGPMIVPDYNVFVVGDNLGLSNDSRNFGPVPITGVVGRATFLFWPSGELGRFGALR